jgi:hypothetical protein
MEFPPELLAKIRKYARPRIKHPVEYLAAKSTLTARVWSILHRRLCDEDADKVLFDLKWYLKAFAERKQVDEEYDDLCASNCGPYTSDLQTRWLEQNRLRKTCRDALWSQDVAYRELMIRMLGEETVDREQLAYVDDDYDYDWDCEN